MCDFHSICVRVDGAIAHLPSNSHSDAVKQAKWAENDSVHKAKRFVECEWNGEGNYPGADKIARLGDGELSKKQRDAIDLHYENLSKALKGDLGALAYFDETKYSDIFDHVLWSTTLSPELVTKFMCDAVKLKKEITALSASATKDGTASSGDYATNASSGDSAKNASSGDSATNASSGHSATNASSGDSAKNASSGDSATNASSGDSAKNASSGDYATNASSGDSATNASSGDYATNASSGHSATNASSGDSAKNASSGDSATNASSGDYATNASSGDYATNASSGDSAKNASSGDSATNASSGDSAKNEGSGKHTVCVAAGFESRAKVGAEGAIALAWYDGKRPRIIVGYAGEDGIKSDTWYEVKNGKLSEIK